MLFWNKQTNKQKGLGCLLMVLCRSAQILEMKLRERKQRYTGNTPSWWDSHSRTPVLRHCKIRRLALQHFYNHEVLIIHCPKAMRPSKDRMNIPNTKQSKSFFLFNVFPPISCHSNGKLKTTEVQPTLSKAKAFMRARMNLDLISFLPIGAGHDGFQTHIQ